MNVYLVVITTVLVLTQVIRIAQNAIQLKRQDTDTLFKKQLGALADKEVTAEDFDMQRQAYRLIVEKLSK